jgi:hypothetical protein
MSGIELTRWTIWLALSAYAIRLGIGCWASTERGDRWARGAWTLGCMSLAAHVAAAFHFYHGWSHAAAYQHTAERSAATAGIEWGGGIYLNHLMLLMWVGDVMWWWSASRSHRRRSAWIEWALQAFFAFMFFNATIVFETGAIRGAGLVAALVLVGLCGLGRQAARSAAR